MANIFSTLFGKKEKFKLGEAMPGSQKKKSAKKVVKSKKKVKK